jgi:hypothetical protein
MPRYDCGDEGEGATEHECGTMTWAARSLNLRQFFFHVPSEHTVNGMHYAMELELIYCDGECTLDTDESGAITPPAAADHDVCPTPTSDCPLRLTCATVAAPHIWGVGPRGLTTPSRYELL